MKEYIYTATFYISISTTIQFNSTIFLIQLQHIPFKNNLTNKGN